MPKYGKPIWLYVLEAAKSLGGVFSPKDIIQKVHSDNSEIPPVTIRSYVIGMAPNHPSSHHYESTRRKHGYLEYLGNGRFRVAREKVQPTSGITRRTAPGYNFQTEFEAPFSQINRRYNKVVEMKRRVEDLIENIGFYIDAFDKKVVFSGPSLYFHFKTLERGRELGTVKAAIFDSLFLDYLYATLASWARARITPFMRRSCPTLSRIREYVPRERVCFVPPVCGEETDTLNILPHNQAGAYEVFC